MDGEGSNGKKQEEKKKRKVMKGGEERRVKGKLREYLRVFKDC